MPALQSMAYPNAQLVVMDMLVPLGVDVRPAPPAELGAEESLIVVRRIGGGPDAEDVTDRPIMLIACYAPTFPAAMDLAADVQTAILSSVLTEVSGVLVDEARVVVGEQEVPDVYPDDRRIVSTYQLGWRRQFRP